MRNPIRRRAVSVTFRNLLESESSKKSLKSFPSSRRRHLRLPFDRYALSHLRRLPYEGRAHGDIGVVDDAYVAIRINARGGGGGVVVVVDFARRFRPRTRN